MFILSVSIPMCYDLRATITTTPHWQMGTLAVSALCLGKKQRSHPYALGREKPVNGNSHPLPLPQLLPYPLERALACSQDDAPRPLPTLSMPETPSRPPSFWMSASSLKPSLEGPFVLRAHAVWQTLPLIADELSGPRVGKCWG